MISFSVLTNENINQAANDILAKNTSVDEEYLFEILQSLSEDEECEIAVCAEDNCLFIRIFDGEYLFSYPVALSDGADEDAAVEKIRSYAVKEEIPLVICNIPADCLDGAMAHFAKCEVYAEDGEESSFELRAFSEICGLSADFPLVSGKISVDMLTEGDKSEYGRLCRDVETNRYWGYDYRKDNPNATDDDFFDTSKAERERGVALSLAVRYEDKFAGELILYAFDYKGGAEYAIRLLPELRGLKIASAALGLTLDFCREIGMKRLYTTISADNAASRRAYEKRFNLIEQNEETLRFALDL